MWKGSDISWNYVYDTTNSNLLVETMCITLLLLYESESELELKSDSDFSWLNVVDYFEPK